MNDMHDHRKTSVVYVSGARIPGPKTHSIQIVNTCAALGKAGIGTTLLIQDQLEHQHDDIFEAYDVSQSFRVVRKKPQRWLKKVPLVGKYLRIASFLVKTFLYLRREQPHTVYSRDWYVAFLYPTSVLEIHRTPENKLFFQKRAFRRANAVLVLTRYMRDFFVKELGVPAEKVHVVPDAVDVEAFSCTENEQKKKDLRREMGVPGGQQLVMYSGQLYRWKGVYTLAESDRYTADNVSIVFLGGSEDDQHALSSEFKDSSIVFSGKKPHSHVPQYLCAADVLVIPNESESRISKYDTSPMKLFEYMATGKPIVASDLPSIREVLDERTATFFEPGNAQDLAAKIAYVKQNPEEAARKARNAFQEVQQYSWERRGEKISHIIVN
jgi:glycosyltransferase involved in cell wall biosynthesis